MTALFQVGKCRGGIRYTSCSGYCMSQLDSQLNGKRRTRTRNISDIVLCIYRILHGKCLARYLRTLPRSLVRFLIQKQRVRKCRTRHFPYGIVFIIYILWHSTFCQFFLFQSFQILKLPKYAAKHREMTKKRRFLKIVIWARIWSNPVITSNFNFFFWMYN